MRWQLIYRLKVSEAFEVVEPDAMKFAFCRSLSEALPLLSVFLRRYGLIAGMKALIKTATDGRWYYCLHDGRNVISDGWITGMSRHYEIDPQGAVIGPVWTDPAWRGRGLAVVGIKSALNKMKSAGNSLFYIDTSSENRAMRKVIAKCGFGEPVVTMDRNEWERGKDRIQNAGAKIRRRVRYLPYPPSSLPVRDMFVLENVPFNRQTRLMEIGVGSGETCARLAHDCGEVVGVDVSRRTVEALSYLEERYSNLKLICIDAGTAGRVDGIAVPAWGGCGFDIAVSCDTLEHVDDPAAFFRFAKENLSVKGSLHVLFPNELPGQRHGVTGFETEKQLRETAEEYFESVEIYRADLSGWSKVVTGCFYGWWKLFRRKVGGKGEKTAPQKFDETAFFSRMDMWKKLSPLINLYWFLMLRLCRMGGKGYNLRGVCEKDFRENCSLYVKAGRRDYRMIGERGDGGGDLGRMITGGFPEGKGI